LSDLLGRVQVALGDAFRVESELPAGGMSRVFLALEVSLNRKVVVKVLPPNMTSEVSAARFRQEMELLARLQHPHILPILSSGSRSELLYYIMPFVAGESLRHRLTTDGKLPIADSVRILVEIADALGYAHAAGVLHRDIKPENILLEGRHAVLADFGVARALADARSGSGGRLTATGVSVGTPGYMSPEQVAGDAIDARAEVYALAVVGYEMISGKPPFEGPSAQAVLAAHLTTPPLPLSEVRPEVPVHVSRAIARALSKQPEERFVTAHDFAEALSGSPTGERPAGIRRSRRGLVAAVTVAGLAALVWVIVQNRGSGLPENVLADIRTAADSGRLDVIATLLDSVGATMAHRDLAGLAAGTSGSVSVTSDPTGAEVSIARATPLAGFATRTYRSLGTTPTTATLLVVGEYSVRLTHAGMVRFLLVRIEPGAEKTASAVFTPADSGRGKGEVVHVSAGPSPVDGSPVEAFLLDQFEVTNERFQRFVTAGGYRDVTLWPATLLLDGRPVPVSEALSRFVDRTGLPGPRGWEGGRYPTDRGNHPVTGITWYEAQAFAKWAGGELPTGHRWWRAAYGDSVSIYPWGVDAVDAQHRANLEGVATTPVGAFALGVSRFGAMDLAGNVREWLADPVPGASRYIAAGGSWQDPFYMADLLHAEGFPPSHTSPTLGFRVAWPIPASSRR